jgi:signal transduction histidine kinase
MTIKHKLQVNTYISLAFGVIAICIVSAVLVRVNSIMDKGSLYQRVIANVFEINILSHQYLSDADESLYQLLAVSASLEAVFRQIAPTSEEERALFNLLREEFRNVNAILTDLRNSREPAGGRIIDEQMEDILSAQLAVNLTNMLLDANSLVELSQKQLHSTQKKAGVAVISLFAFLVLLNALASYYTSRNISTSLAMLGSGVSLITQGNLDHRIPIRGSDEIADLSLAFNEMSDRLRSSYAEQKEYASELERSNRELQDFAFITSHDLQEPLRKIQAFASRIRVQYEPVLDEKGSDYLWRMERAAHRMQDLIHDLLKYSRLTTRPEPFKIFNLSDPVKEAIMDLKVLIEETGGQVEVADLPIVEADPIQMRQLFQNLIANALKFHGEKTPMVKVYSHGCFQGFCEIFVEDNGIGFDEKYIGKIFTPFQRLNKKDQYEGSGMGLAICQKIVERHRGAITASSSPGQGSTFVVRLPLEQPGEEAEAPPGMRLRL